MYICRTCGEQFDEPREGRDEEGYAFGRCPDCGEDDYDELRRCPVCGEWTEADAGDVCEACSAAIESGLGALLTGLQVVDNRGKEAVICAIAAWVERQ